MKKVILMFFAVFIVFADNNEQLYKEIGILKDEIKSLKQQIRENKDSIDEGFEILDDVERKYFMDKVNFSPSLMIRLDKMRYENKYIEGETNQERYGYTKNFSIASAIYFDLDMNAELSDDVTFFGRISFAFNSQSYQRLCILSRDIKSQKAHTVLDVTLAYFNYYIDKSTTLSIGLLPTFNGTPMQFAQNRPRESMFPALVFDMNSYGAILTKKFQKSYIRFITAKGYTLEGDFYPFQCNRENIENATIIGIFSDISFEILGDDLFSFGVNMIKDFKSQPYLGPDIYKEHSEDSGDIYTIGFGLDSKNIADTKATIFFHLASSLPNNNGHIEDYSQELNVTGNYATGTLIKKPGYAVFAGIRYDINDNFIFGAEYNYGSKYWYATTQGSRDMYNKLAQRGHAIETYGSWLFHKNMFLKLGYLHMGEDYTGSGWHIGEPAKKDALNQIVYLKYNVKF